MGNSRMKVVLSNKKRRILTISTTNNTTLLNNKPINNYSSVYVVQCISKLFNLKLIFFKLLLHAAVEYFNSGRYNFGIRVAN